MTTECSGFTLDQTAEIADEQDLHVMVLVIHNLKTFTWFHFDPQFLLNLSFEALSRIFAVFNLSSRKLPEEPTTRVGFSLNHENPVVLDDDCCCHRHDHWFSVLAISV
jgi:hypothetical protein